MQSHKQLKALSDYNEGRNDTLDLVRIAINARINNLKQIVIDDGEVFERGFVSGVQKAYNNILNDLAMIEGDTK